MPPRDTAHAAHRSDRRRARAAAAAGSPAEASRSPTATTANRAFRSPSRWAAPAPPICWTTPLLSNPLLKAFNRVILIVTFNAMPRVLMDGIITHQQLTPSNRPGEATLTVTGEDVSVMMDLEEKSVEHPAQDETVIALKLIASYAQYGLIPKVIPPPMLDPPLPIERMPVQQGTDLQYLKKMAERYGYVFYITPGPAPLTQYRLLGSAGTPGRSATGACSQHGAGDQCRFDQLSQQCARPHPAGGQGPGPHRPTRACRCRPSPACGPRSPPCRPGWSISRTCAANNSVDSGVNTMQAFARAQGMTDASIDAVVAEGELDALRYGDLLQAARAGGRARRWLPATMVCSTSSG